MNSYLPMSTLAMENQSDLQIKRGPKKDFPLLKKSIVMPMPEGSLKSGTRKIFAQMLTLWSKNTPRFINSIKKQKVLCQKLS